MAFHHGRGAIVGLSSTDRCNAYREYGKLEGGDSMRLIVRCFALCNGDDNLELNLVRRDAILSSIPHLSSSHKQSLLTTPTVEKLELMESPTVACVLFSGTQERLETDRKEVAAHCSNDLNLRTFYSKQSGGGRQAVKRQLSPHRQTQSKRPEPAVQSFPAPFRQPYPQPFQQGSGRGNFTCTPVMPYVVGVVVDLGADGAAPSSTKSPGFVEPVGACLLRHWQNWQELGADRRIVNILRWGFPLRSLSSGPVTSRPGSTRRM